MCLNHDNRRRNINSILKTFWGPKLIASVLQPPCREAPRNNRSRQTSGRKIYINTNCHKNSTDGFQSTVPPTFHYQFAGELNSVPFLPVCHWILKGDQVCVCFIQRRCSLLWGARGRGVRLGVQCDDNGSWQKPNTYFYLRTPLRRKQANKKVMITKQRGRGWV